MSVIAHWKLNDNAASSTVVDDTGVYNGTYKDGSGNINTSTGANTGVGYVGTALDFDGDEYVEIGDNAIFTFAKIPFSISAWIYMDSATSFPIITKGVYNTSGEWRLATETNDKLYAVVFDESVADCYIGRIYNTAIAASTWYHVVMTYDGGITSASIKLYLNGANVDNANNENEQASFVSSENLTHAVWIGRDDGTYADGLIDNVILFSHELTVDEIKVLYSGGHGTEIVADLDESRRIQRRPIWQL